MCTLHDVIDKVHGGRFGRSSVRPRLASSARGYAILKRGPAILGRLHPSLQTLPLEKRTQPAQCTWQQAKNAHKLTPRMKGIILSQLCGNPQGARRGENRISPLTSREGFDLRWNGQKANDGDGGERFGSASRSQISRDAPTSHRPPAPPSTSLTVQSQPHPSLPQERCRPQLEPWWMWIGEGERQLSVASRD